MRLRGVLPYRWPFTFLWWKVSQKNLKKEPKFSKNIILKLSLQFRGDVCNLSFQCLIALLFL